MGGNFLGGAVALLYFLMFQLCGVTLAACFLNKERRYTQMILGSAAGSVLLMGCRRCGHSCFRSASQRMFWRSSHCLC